MQRFLDVLSSLCLVVALAACSPLDKTYLREGIGSDLYRADVADETRLQDLYVQHICQQSGLAPGTLCNPDAFGPTAWTAFVQAGMNDIDQRCDAYLVWLDARRRAREPVLQEISDVRTATTAILAATGVGVEPIAIAAAAFGLASSSFTNVNSSLVFALDQSTVQSVVLTNQARYRNDLPHVIDNRSAAIYALRSYMRLCMPMTIDTEVNTTVRLFQQGDRLNVSALAAAKNDPMINAKVVRTAIIGRATEQVPVQVPRVRVIDAVRVGPFEQSMSQADVTRLQGFACVTPADGRFTPDTRRRILDVLRRDSIKDAHFPDEITDKDAQSLEFERPAGRC